MLMRLALVLIAEAAGRMVTGEAAGLAEEDREDTKLLAMIYILETCNDQPDRLFPCLFLNLPKWSFQLLR